MTKPFECDDKARLVAYVYDEVDGAADREGIEAHLAGCRACAAELEGLQAVRVELGSWQPPDSELGFRIVQEPAPVRPPWWRAHAWAPVALAAGLVLAVGAALTNVEVQVGDGSVTMRAGWAHAPLQAPPAVPVQSAAARVPAEPATVAPGMTPAQVQRLLADFETRLRSEMVANQRPAVATVATSSTGVDRQQIVQQMHALVDESERRQQRELALRLAQVVQDFDTQRRTDLVRIEQGFGQIENLTGQEAARQRAIANYLVRASQRQQ